MQQVFLIIKKKGHYASYGAAKKPIFLKNILTCKLSKWRLGISGHESFFFILGALTHFRLNAGSELSHSFCSSPGDFSMLFHFSQIDVTGARLC